MNILYFDNHIVVVNKNAGIVTEGEGIQSLEALTAVWIRETYQKPGKVFVKAVHRLDKPASGIVVLAKTTKALTRLQEAFRQREVEKKYVACVEGHVLKPEATLEDFLVHDQYKARVSHALDPDAKFASLFYQSRSSSLLELTLHTGRYHQIRIQLASRGHPIVNDTRYGASYQGVDEEIGLHHYSLAFDHPVSKEELHFNVPIPLQWKQRGWK